MGILSFMVHTQGLLELNAKLARAGPKAKHAMAVQMAKDTEQFVPARTGLLSYVTRVKDDTIIYPGPYAHYLYGGKLFIDPHTGSAWAPKGASKVITGKNLNISKAMHGKAQSHWFEASKAQNLDKWIRVAGRVIRREFRG